MRLCKHARNYLRFIAEGIIVKNIQLMDFVVAKLILLVDCGFLCIYDNLCEFNIDFWLTRDYSTWENKCKRMKSFVFEKIKIKNLSSIAVFCLYKYFKMTRIRWKYHRQRDWNNINLWYYSTRNVLFLHFYSYMVFRKN